MREAQIGDAPLLALVHATAFERPWSIETFEAFLAEPGTCALIDDDGFILWRAVGGEAEILTLAVAPAARRRGLARCLVAQMLDLAARSGAQSMFLEVSDQNTAAMALYTGAGFEVAGRRAGYYETSAGRQDALIMRLALTGASVRPISKS